MVLLYVRGRGEAPPGTEVSLERVEGLSVEDLQTTVARQLKIEKEELSLMYGGCILRNGKTLDQYQIKDGCTLHVMQHKKKVKYAPLPLGPEGMSVVFSSPAIQSEIAPFINDPDQVARMVPLGDPSAVREILKDPNFLRKVSDMTRVSYYVHKNYLLFPVMQAILRLHRHKYGVHDTGRMERLSVQVGEIFSSGVGGAVGRGSARARVWATSVDDVSLEDLMDSEIPLGQVQAPSEASIDHPLPNSQIMHGTIHHLPMSTSPSATVEGATDHPLPNSQIMHGTIHHLPMTTSSSASSSTIGGATAAIATPPSFNVTTADLVSALASIGTEQSDSQPTSLSLESSSQPQSLPIFNPNYTGSSAPASLRTSELLPVPVPAPVNRSLSDSGRGDMGTGRATASISQVDLQQALSLALSTVQQQQTSSDPIPQSVPFSVIQQTPHTHTQQSSSAPAPPVQPNHSNVSLRQQYQAHLEQLHAMGITYSDSECLHALEAAQGDLQTALEILMGPGN